MRNIWLISDTHERHDEIKVPKNIDMVIHAGDEANSSNPWVNFKSSLKFFEWFSNLDIEHKIFVPGNHSTAIFNGFITEDFAPTVKFLIHDEIIIDGYKIFGSPYTPSFGKSWAYMKDRSKLHDVWATIPEDTDILVTHGPPKGILDLCDDIDDHNQIFQAGCKALRNRVEVIKPKVHVFGHIHSSEKFSNQGMYYSGQTYFVNASCLDHSGNVSHGLVLNT